MARTGEVAIKNLGEDSDDFAKGLHSTGKLDPNNRYISHFPETREIISFNSGYGGNALQGKKCFALRIASRQGKDEGWMAEHMLILGITSPEGKKTYVCAAFPSACGKTNLAMLIPPKAYLDAGWKIETVGDDIAWLNIGEDGRLYAINPEAGFFGVAPGTSSKTNPNALKAVQLGNNIFTNTAYDVENKTPWWEGMDGDKPNKAIDWLGNSWTPESTSVAAHANSRFTCPASNCPCISDEWESPNGVPISAIIFGGRRAKTAPLVYEALDWQHGTFVGVTMASESTAAAKGKLGVLKRDPMAMRPFIGYHAGDYFQHWLDIGKKASDLPSIFHVNWFKTDDDGNFIWPGFGDNMRILEWIVKRSNGDIKEVNEIPLGYQPKIDDLNLEGLSIDTSCMEELLKVNKEDWNDELISQSEFFETIGEKLPKEMLEEYNNLKSRLDL
ncbi:UNVERIFIED_CONTAM: hypothetical protein GTU68_011781 [Idotea baltica]|nr:hypothetical protein [Idotea baltica]